MKNLSKNAADPTVLPRERNDSPAEAEIARLGGITKHQQGNIECLYHSRQAEGQLRAKAEAQAAALRDLLEGIQWAGGGDTADERCPVCLGNPDFGGHTATCKLAAALRGDITQGYLGPGDVQILVEGIMEVNRISPLVYYPFFQRAVEHIEKLGRNKKG